jgi:hypothetical protein
MILTTENTERTEFFLCGEKQISVFSAISVVNILVITHDR